MTTTKRIPGWQAPEDGFIIAPQKPENGIEIFSLLGVYCRVCYPVSRDLAVFSRPHERDGDKVVITTWDVRLDELASSADEGCHFCSFMACRFFDDRMFSFLYGNGSTTERIACCGDAPRSQKTESISRAIANIRSFAEKHLDAELSLVIQPRDYSKDDLKFGKVRLSGFRSNLDRASVDELLGYRSYIDLELYALKGMFAFSVDMASRELC